MADAQPIPGAVTLSAEQQEIVDYRGGHLQVIACAGSGKTESISRRVASLINEGEVPESIVAFTFTEKAATELKDRIYQRVAEAKGEAEAIAIINKALAEKLKIPSHVILFEEGEYVEDVYILLNGKAMVAKKFIQSPINKNEFK